MNKDETIKIYAAASLDDRGYRDKYLAFFPFAAAAEEYLEVNKGGYYSNVQTLNAIKIDDLHYIVKSEIHGANKIIETFPTFTPIEGFQRYEYTAGYDKSVYFIDFNKIKEVLKHGAFDSLGKVILFRTDEKYYLLERLEPVKLTPFIKSQKMAIKHALSKLTDEEKKLLGLK